MKRKKVLITGASGFIGRSMVEYLSASGSYEVFACEDATADLRDESAVSGIILKFQPDVIINCAAVGLTPNTSGTDVVAANLRMFLNLTRVMTPAMRMIHLGSGAEYDKRYCKPKMAESYFDTHVPADPYGYSKYAISKYIEKTDNIVCLRVFGLYGKYEDYTSRFISNSIVKNLLGMPIVINRNVRFDYLYMADFLGIVERMLALAPRHKFYNVTPSETVDLVSIASAINGISSFKSEVRTLNPGLNPEYSGDNARLLSELKGFSFTPIGSAVGELYGYYRDTLASLNTEAVRTDEYLARCSGLDGKA